MNPLRLICWITGKHKESKWCPRTIKETRVCPRCGKRQFRPIQPVSEEPGPLERLMIDEATYE